MFTSLSTFSIFFFSVAAFLLIGIIFEEKFLKLEDKFDDYFAGKRKAKKSQQTKNCQLQKNKNFKRNTQNNMHSNNKRTHYRNYAA